MYRPTLGPSVKHHDLIALWDFPATVLPVTASHVVHLDIPAGVVASSTRERLQVFVSSPPRTSLVVLESELSEVALAAGRSIGSALLSSEHALSTDLKVVEPEGDRWTIAELDEKVIAPAAYIPVERNVVVVGRADSMDRPAAEHLLKTVEEPTSDTLFLFCVPSASTLLPTIQGRAGAVLGLEAAPRPERIAALVGSGLPEDVATEVVDLAGSSPALTGAVAAADEESRSSLLDDLRSLGTSPLGTERPSATAYELGAALERLAWAASNPSAKRTAKSKPTLTPQGRAQLRMLLRDRIAAWRRECTAALRTVTTPTDLERVTTRLEALDRAELELSSYAPAANVLAALLSRSAL